MEERLLAIIGHQCAQLQVMQEALMQLLEQTVAPDPEAAQRFEAGMHARTNQLLVEADPPDAMHEQTMTLLLAALLQSAGRPPLRG